MKTLYKQFFQMLNSDCENQNDSVASSGGGVLTYLGERGCAALMGRFIQKIRKHGSHFLPKKSLNMGQLFWLSPKLRDFHHVKTQKIMEFLKNRPIFEGKSLKMGTLFGQNHP